MKLKSSTSNCDPFHPTPSKKKTKEKAGYSRKGKRGWCREFQFFSALFLYSITFLLLAAARAAASISFIHLPERANKCTAEAKTAPLVQQAKAARRAEKKYGLLCGLTAPAFEKESQRGREENPPRHLLISPFFVFVLYTPRPYICDFLAESIHRTEDKGAFYSDRDKRARTTDDRRGCCWSD